MNKHIVIIGGGVIGLCTAHFCLKRGHRVTIIERGPAGHDGCSFGNAGLVVPSHFRPPTSPQNLVLGLKWLTNRRSPFHIRPRINVELIAWLVKFLRHSNNGHVQRAAPLLRDLELASRELYDELADELDDFEFVRKGLLVMCRTPEGREALVTETEFANRLGITAHLLSADEVKEMEPNIRMDTMGAIHYPQDGHLTPAKLMASLDRRLRDSGAQFVWNTEVTGWRQNGSRAVAVAGTGAEYDGDDFVIATGSWTPLIARRLGLRCPVMAGKGYNLTLPNPPQLPQHSILCNEARVAVTPMGGALRFAGTLEIGPRDHRIGNIRVQAIKDAVARYFPDYTSDVFDGIEPWCGLRPCTPDGLPYIGRGGRYANVWVAAGHAMSGVSLAPITAKLISEMVSGEQPAIPVAALSPDR